MEKVKKLIEQEKTEVQVTLEETEVLSPGRKESFHCDKAEDLHSSNNNTTNKRTCIQMFIYYMLGTLPNA